ncbi:MAG: hypothetical protein OEO20_11270 [Gemmatimonadota bacterium]|nr:hypothetical protein [Gemmatimonadota bacterium]MDH3367913.1 hypothetical protein [Gemmatimonadota bacterium]MDH3478873.1 hypothetical protein [Gemmatimonadota bacterium]MDH3570295.1 hypothetical protein [Gemmatimonadota bacterium]
MTVPFGPRVLPTARSQMGGAERFLDTATRAFEEAAAFVESQRENTRRQQEFESAQQLSDLRSSSLAQEIEQRSEAAMRERAADPRFVTGEAARIPAPATEARQAPFPEQEQPDVSAEISQALRPTGGLQELRPPRPGLRPTGVEGEFFDPEGEQRAQQGQFSQSAQRVQELLERLATQQEQAGNPELANAIRGQGALVTTQVEAGNNPAQVVRSALEDVQTRGQRQGQIDFLIEQVGPENVPPGFELLTGDQQIEELERIRTEQGRLQRATETRTGGRTGGTTQARMTPTAAAALLRSFNDIINENTGVVEGHRATPAQLLGLIDKMVAGTATPEDFLIFDEQGESIPILPPIYAATPEGETGLIRITQQDWDDLIEDGLTPDQIHELYDVPPDVGR